MIRITRASAARLPAGSPTSDANIYGDAYKTLFVGRLAFETTEKRLQREFEEFGPVVRVRVVRDRHGNSRGYGFVEFANEDDLKVAYRRADGRKIDGRRILVDVERGRTVPGESGGWMRTVLTTVDGTGASARRISGGAVMGVRSCRPSQAGCCSCGVPRTCHAVSSHPQPRLTNPSFRTPSCIHSHACMVLRCAVHANTHARFLAFAYLICSVAPPPSGRRPG